MNANSGTILNWFLTLAPNALRISLLLRSIAAIAAAAFTNGKMLK